MSYGDSPEKKRYSPKEMQEFKRKFCNEVVIAMYDKKCYSVKDLHFDKSPASLPIPGKNFSHAEYFAKKKGINLRFPNATPMIEVLGRNDSSIYLPAELVCANELEPHLKSKLPMIASWTPDVRHAAIEEIRRYLIPGEQKSRGGGDLLPALGFTLKDSRVRVGVTKLPLPIMSAAGVKIPASAGSMWAPQSELYCLFASPFDDSHLTVLLFFALTLVSKANYKVNPNHAVTLKVILVYHRSLKNSMNVYNTIKKMANDYNSTYRLSDKPCEMIEAGDREKHWGAVEKYFDTKKAPDSKCSFSMHLDESKMNSKRTNFVVRFLNQMLSF